MKRLALLGFILISIVSAYISYMVGGPLGIFA